jgi:lysophospholipase L1-like esterase
MEEAMKPLIFNNQVRLRQFRSHAWLFVLFLSLFWFWGNGFASDAIGAQQQILDCTTPPAQAQDNSVAEPPTLLIGLGDSLTHGTMDATNNATNSLNAYLQQVVDSLAQKVPLHFSQPLFDEYENRLQPFRVPTNLGIDGSDTFSLIGLEYYKRVGTSESFFSRELLADRLLPGNLKDKYDKVLYPINLLAKRPISQLGSAAWLLNHGAPSVGIEKALVILWIGNNDSSTAALGTGGRNPAYQPLPFDLVKFELKPLLRLLLGFGEQSGAISFEPFTQAAIERNLTDINDFIEQYERIVNWLEFITFFSPATTELLLLTLPYYSAVGYLMDSEDLEFYLQKLDPDYAIPSTFQRVAPPGEPIADPLKGDRISLLTFGLMYALMSTGHSMEDVNRVLEIDGQQRDGLVLSEEEQQSIMTRINAFNDAINSVAASSGANVHIIDIGQYLNNTLTGKEEIIIDGRVLSRKWIRGSGFSLDGVHPGYTGHALIANFILEQLNSILGLCAPLYELTDIIDSDPYVDQDRDGWAPGPQYEASGAAELLFLFKDPDDSNPEVQAEMPPNVWDVISDVLLKEILNIPAIQAEAQRLSIGSTE